MESNFQSKIIFLLMGVLIFSTGCQKSTGIRSYDAPYQLSNQVKSQLASGDIILRKGDGILSSFICERLNDTLEISHCGILYKEDSLLNVIHSLSKDVSDTDGVQICSLDHFTEESMKGSVIIVRFREDTTGTIASQALYYLHTHKPFDHLFNAKDSSAFFCSELPLHIIKYSLHTDLFASQSHSPRFSLFLNPRYFDCIFIDNQSFRNRSH